MYRKNAWKEYADEQIRAVMDFNEGYKDFLSKGKTERICVQLTKELAVAKGFKSLEEILANGEKIKTGDKIYAENMGKNMALFVIGKQPLDVLAPQ